MTADCVPRIPRIYVSRSIFDGDRDATVYLPSSRDAFSSHNRPASLGVIRGLQPYFDETALRPAPAKRRLVVRLPFAQNPDTMQLSRIYKGLFSQQKRFLIPMKNWDE
ncbi:hypothetical protein AAVH_15086 [Aphelenchoides avenae]|nr:hypothetical protein AAVH_15086 [Aphelenchus avenae]